MNKKFALIGAAGYIAPKHMQAIKETGNELIAAFDPSDSVGILDSYFPDARFFVSYERFERFLAKKKFEEGESVDYISICSPNYLHDTHIRFALQMGHHVICEKPMVLSPWNIKVIEDAERLSGGNVYNILQLRHHPEAKALKQKVEKSSPNEYFELELTYITARGSWYATSWKGDEEKSGGIAANIGIHFFDMLCWIFGDVKENVVYYNSATATSGTLYFKQARVRWFLSIDRNFLPQKTKQNNGTFYRSVVVNGEEIDLSEGFTNLHTLSYENIVNGNGFGVKEVISSINLVYKIRTALPVLPNGSEHSLLTML